MDWREALLAWFDFAKSSVNRHRMSGKLPRTLSEGVVDGLSFTTLQPAPSPSKRHDHRPTLSSVFGISSSSAAAYQGAPRVAALKSGLVVKGVKGKEGWLLKKWTHKAGWRRAY